MNLGNGNTNTLEDGIAESLDSMPTDNVRPTVHNPARLIPHFSTASHARCCVGGQHHETPGHKRAQRVQEDKPREVESSKTRPTE